MHEKFENDIIWDYAEPPENNGNSGLAASDTSSENIRWWVLDSFNAKDSTTDSIFATHLVSRLQQQSETPFFYGLGLGSTHLPFMPILKFWDMNGDPNSQQLLKTDHAGNYNGLKGAGSNTIQLPQIFPGDRNDIPGIALPVQRNFPDTECQNMIHAYDAEVTMLDAQLGLVLDELDRQHLWENTVVVFWSDHGQHLGEHEGAWRKNTLFEESLHIPLIVCVPGRKPGTCQKLVELVDLYPTLAELCGLPIPDSLEGTSFAPLLDNPEFKWKPAVFSQVSATVADLGRSITTDAERYNNWGDFGEELYDHRTDPHEFTNLFYNSLDSINLIQMKKLMVSGWQSVLPPSYKKNAWYRDSDNDGYGSPVDSLVAYWSLPGYVSNNKDCNDSDASVYPNAPEICDGKDNNCDGQVDENCLPFISINTRSIIEGNSGTTTMVFTVSLSQASASRVKVTASTVDSTAVKNADYIVQSTLLRFPPGITSKKFKVSIIGDNIPEDNEFFKVLLSNPVNARIKLSTGIGTIKNDDQVLTSAQSHTQVDKLSVEKSQGSEGIFVWPNPVSRTILMRLDRTTKNRLKIILRNARGVPVKNWSYLPGTTYSVIKLELPMLPNGEYFLSITDDSGQQTKKIMILN